MERYLTDPYYALGVSVNDTDEHIYKSYKKRAKRYHPDRAKTQEDRKLYEKYFKIITAALESIQNTRRSSNSLKNEYYEDQASKKNDGLREFGDLRNFNIDFENRIGLNTRRPEEFGYGEQTRLTSKEEYENFKTKIVNQFKKKKFTTRDFNRLFEYIKQKYGAKDGYDIYKDVTKTLVHKTSDGFYGYNTSDTNNCSLVSSYNGLLIVGDDFGDSGKGYWDGNYSDYKWSFSGAKNPMEQIREIPDDIIIPEEKVVPQRTFKTFKKQYNDALNGIEEKRNHRNFKDITKEYLREKQEKDKHMIMKYSNSFYDRDTIKQSIDGNLKRSITYLDVLDGVKTIKQ
jgi:curved DNA-binding protein CbpA